MSNTAQLKDLTLMQEKIKQVKSKFERLKGQESAVIKQLNQMSLDPEKAEDKLNNILNQIKKLENAIEKESEEFFKKYPQLGE
jgi:septation ring formation regulator EzrA